MARTVRSSPKQQQKQQPIVEDHRPIERFLPRSAEPGDPTKPIRTVVYLEVGDLPAPDVRKLCATLLHNYQNGHPHYVCVLRNNKITTDLDFEGEFLSVAKQLCEIKDGEIQLKNGAQDVEVLRVRL